MEGSAVIIVFFSLSHSLSIFFVFFSYLVSLLQSVQGFKFVTLVHLKFSICTFFQGILNHASGQSWLFFIHDLFLDVEAYQNCI